jgi:hypothetical protein
MNIYNRCFDDQSQLRIRLETAAIEGIFEFAEAGVFELVWSFMLDYETALILTKIERNGWSCHHDSVPIE